MGKEWFLYVVTNNDLHRLKLDEKLKTKRYRPQLRQPPVVELEHMEVENFISLFPSNMQHITMDSSEICLVGGYLEEGEPNLDGISYIIDPNERCPLVISLSHPDLRSSSPAQTSVILSQFGSSFYVLDPSDMSFYVLEQKESEYTKRSLHFPPELYQRYPEELNWDSYRMLNHTNWGQKIQVNNCNGYSYIFDIYKETWNRFIWNEFRSAVEYKGYLIGLCVTGEVVCCKMDSDGNPAGPIKVLNDVNDIFKTEGPEGCSFRGIEQSFMGSYEDGGEHFIWLVYTLSASGIDMDVDCGMQFVLLKVFFEIFFNDDSYGNPVVRPNVDVEAAEVYKFDGGYGILCTAFAACATTDNLT